MSAIEVATRFAEQCRALGLKADNDATKRERAAGQTASSSVAVSGTLDGVRLFLDCVALEDGSIVMENGAALPTVLAHALNPDVPVITMEEWSAIHSDFKVTTREVGRPAVRKRLVMRDGATVLEPVRVLPRSAAR